MCKCQHVTRRCFVGGVQALGAAAIVRAFRESINYLHNNVNVKNGNAINNNNSNSNKVHQFIQTLRQVLSIENVSLNSFSFQLVPVADGSVTELFSGAHRFMISVICLLKNFNLSDK